MNTIIIGAGGHARVVCSILDSSDPNVNVVGFVDFIPHDPEETIYGRNIIAELHELPDILANKVAVAGIVGIGDNETRKSRYNLLKQHGFITINAIHKTANIERDVQLGKGVVVCSGAYLCPMTSIGDNTIINTGTIIEHETQIGNHCHIAPGVNIAGRVKIGDGTFVGIGSTIKEYVKLGANVTVGAGTVILEDVPDNAVVVGSPARIAKFKE